MQITPNVPVPISPPIGPQNGLLPGSDGTGAPMPSPVAGQHAAPPPAERSATLPATAAAPGVAASDSPVSLSAAAQQSAARQNSPAPVYAEIWQGSIKIAQVDLHGHVTSFSPLLASGGGGLAGPVQAAQRAVQVARMTGGEIRSAGQSLDGQTLMMRARLANTYAV